MAAAGIAVANVLGPVLVRVIVQEWSQQGRSENPAVSARRLGLLTGVLTAVISASAGVASGVSVPLAEALDGGWRWVLGLWAVPVVIAALCMALLSRMFARAGSTAVSGAVESQGGSAVLRSPSRGR